MMRKMIVKNAVEVLDISEPLIEPKQSHVPAAVSHAVDTNSANTTGSSIVAAAVAAIERPAEAERSAAAPTSTSENTTNLEEGDTTTNTTKLMDTSQFSLPPEISEITSEEDCDHDVDEGEDSSDVEDDFANGNESSELPDLSNVVDAVNVSGSVASTAHNDTTENHNADASTFQDVESEHGQEEEEEDIPDSARRNTRYFTPIEHPAFSAAVPKEDVSAEVVEKQVPLPAAAPVPKIKKIVSNSSVIKVTEKVNSSTIRAVEDFTPPTHIEPVIKPQAIGMSPKKPLPSSPSRAANLANLAALTSTPSKTAYHPSEVSASAKAANRSSLTPVKLSFTPMPTAPAAPAVSKPAPSTPKTISFPTAKPMSVRQKPQQQISFPFAKPQSTVRTITPPVVTSIPRTNAFKNVSHTSKPVKSTKKRVDSSDLVDILDGKKEKTMSDNSLNNLMLDDSYAYLGQFYGDAITGGNSKKPSSKKAVAVSSAKKNSKGEAKKNKKEDDYDAEYAKNLKESSLWYLADLVGGGDAKQL
ncbi:unnamed protein product [Ambrosiozyma monospora]|uniref:Unnamed protein product n=1 Tax=Ambrosiozyma monospora TaxID=43982 RepID=A0ACB5TBG4_AMBMO|nr:unnamed protein product [Ambrosiozyma monospora]